MKQKRAFAALALALGASLAAVYAPSLSPACASIDPALVDDAISDEPAASSDEGSTG